MKTVKISLNSIDKVKSFVNDITKFESDFDLVSGRYVIDAKSIMGIFSLDLSKPMGTCVTGRPGLGPDPSKQFTPTHAAGMGRGYFFAAVRPGGPLCA